MQIPLNKVQCEANLQCASIAMCSAKEKESGSKGAEGKSLSERWADSMVEVWTI